MSSSSSTRVSFADLLKKGAEKDQQKTTDKPKLSVVETKAEPTPPILPTPPTKPTPRTPPTQATQATLNRPVAPEKDYAKVANSIVRDAVANGSFIGKSKQIYDSLYLQTRGAVQPKRSVRITKLNLMRASDIGSERTLLKNISHLKSIGLVKITEYDGQHEGNEYEVFLPEEVDGTHPTPPQPPYPLQKVGRVPSVESGVGGVGQMQENKDVYSSLKTSFKDSIKTDDEESASALFSGFIEKFQTAAKKMTGAPLSKYEREKWERLADLLILELETAGRRASNPVSSVPAFLTKVLSSKLLNQKPVERSTKSKTNVKPDTVGKYYPELDSPDDEIKSLNDESKEAAVEFLREFKDDAEFLDGYKKWYTEEDWNWIIKQLEIK